MASLEHARMAVELRTGQHELSAALREHGGVDHLPVELRDRMPHLEALRKAIERPAEEVEVLVWQELSAS